MRVFWGTVAAAVIVAASAGCASAPPQGSLAATPVAETQAAEPAITVESVIDGDTIETSAGTVRIIGVDAPEQGECGYDEATALVSSLIAPGDPVVLELPPGENDTDKYGRILRYVDTVQGVDVAASLLSAGLAVARYDSTDGYPAHPRETAYRAAQVAMLSADGAVTTVACKAAADADQAARFAAEQQAAQQQATQQQATQQQATQQQATQQQAPADAWWMKYSSCGKLKKNTVGDPTGPFSRDDPAQAAAYDWFENGTGNNGDGDDDGYACE